MENLSLINEQFILTNVHTPMYVMKTRIISSIAVPFVYVLSVVLLCS